MQRRNLKIGERYCVLIEGQEVIVTLDYINGLTGSYYTTSQDGKKYHFKRARSFLCPYIEPVTDSMHPEGL